MYIYEGNGPAASVASQMRRCNIRWSYQNFILCARLDITTAAAANSTRPRRLGRSGPVVGRTWGTLPILYALPRALPEFRNAHIAGEIVYPDHAQHVPHGSINWDFSLNLSTIIRRIAGPEPPLRVPSAADTGDF